MVSEHAREKSDSPMLSLISTTRLLTQSFEREVGMSHARIRILAKLRREGTLLQRDLQSHLDIDAAAVSRQLRSLEEEGHVVRTASATDSRQVEVALSAKGRAEALRVAEARRSFEADVFSLLSEQERRQLLEGLRTVEKALVARRQGRGKA